MFSISLHVEKDRANKTRLMYWTGREWSGRHDDAMQFMSLPVAKKVARGLSRDWHAIVGVNQISEPLASLRDPATRERRKRNPTGSGSVAKSRKLFKDFRGDSPGSVRPVKVTIPKSGLCVGELDGVLYTTIRDGVTEKYQHKFRKQSRPLLVSSDDGLSLHIIGGKYEFTERGIVDK